MHVAEEIQTLLKKKRLSITDSRANILSVFLTKKSTGALAHADIEEQTAGKFDRVTIYRTLQTFVEKGLIHTIPSADNMVRYALCKEECTQGQHHDHHIHFICNQCGHTTCLEEVVIPPIQLPKGYIAQGAEMVVNGICKKCTALIKLRN
jgi:Fur family transcriptional regulator, ferric uptake regulator